MKLVFTMIGTENYPGEENSVLIHQRQKRKRKKKSSKQAKNLYMMNAGNKSD